MFIIVNLIALILSAFTVGILWGPSMVGTCAVALKRLDGQSAQVWDVFEGLKSFLPGLMYGIATLGLSFLLAVLCQATCVLAPLSFLAPVAVVTALAFAPFLIWEQRVGGVRALQASFEMAKPVFLMLAVYVLVLEILSSLGMLVCGVGIVLTMPLLPAGLAVAYRQMSSAGISKGCPESPRPPSSP